MRLSDKIEWLLTKSGLRPYGIGKAIGLSTQSIDPYRKDLNKIKRMGLARAELLEDYMGKLTWEEVVEARGYKKTIQLIQIVDYDDDELVSLFENIRFVCSLKWMDENEERLEIGVETYSPGPFKNEPYSVEELAFLREFNQELKEDFVDYIQACGEMIVTESGEVLYQVREGRYRIVYAERDNQRNGAPKILDVESVLEEAMPISLEKVLKRLGGKEEQEGV